MVEVTSKEKLETLSFSDKLQIPFQNNKMQLHNVGGGPQGHAELS
jgi:hypothetical protein